MDTYDGYVTYSVSTRAILFTHLFSEYIQIRQYFQKFVHPTIQVPEIAQDAIPDDSLEHIHISFSCRCTSVRRAPAHMRLRFRRRDGPPAERPKYAQTCAAAQNQRFFTP